jgi:hypothetical protein
MQIPTKIPSLNFITVLMGIYAVIWISLEGLLWREIILGVGVTAVSLLHLLQKYGGGHVVSLAKWVGATATLGLLLGLGSSLLTLVFMAVKTGLHAHGPEFTLQEIQWVSRQIPLWAVAGLLIGISLGMLTANDHK